MEAKSELLPNFFGAKIAEAADPCPWVSSLGGSPRGGARGTPKPAVKSELKKKKLVNLAEAYSRGELRVNPDYQRGVKWTLAQKQGLLDSLLRGYQVPLFYVHLIQKKNEFTDGVETTAELVDGQQRLAAICSFLNNEFKLPVPQLPQPHRGEATSARDPHWSGKTFFELCEDDKARLLDSELSVVQMNEENRNEVRDLFIRLQAGTPLTAQEKRDAWPGDFTDFVIRHAGKPGHRLSHPKEFFNLFPRSRRMSVADEEHYVDGLVETRKFFAGLAMTIMVRERSGVDFVDLKGRVINEFYQENLEMSEADPACHRVLRVLDTISRLPGFAELRNGPRLSFQMGFHLAVLVDSLIAGDYVPVWREDVVDAFRTFQADCASARLHHKKTRQSVPHFEHFIRLLGGSGSDTAEVIRLRHSFLLNQIYSRIRITARDPNRRFDALEKEVIWNRDGGQCQNPHCPRPGRKVAFSEATIHHVREHTAGGATTLQNGVLICPECHTDRAEMQRLAHYFQDYLTMIYSPATGNSSASPLAPWQDQSPRIGNVEDEPQAESGKLRLIIRWGELDVDREDELICENKASESVAKILGKLISEFGPSMRAQLMELPVIRYPLAKDRSGFVMATGKQLASIRVPGTDLYLCAHSDNHQKVKELSRLFSQLTLPDGRGFPPDSIQVIYDAA